MQSVMCRMSSLHKCEMRNSNIASETETATRRGWEVLHLIMTEHAVQYVRYVVL